MPPIRRTTKPASSGRRPKIAGRGGGRPGSEVRAADVDGDSNLGGPAAVGVAVVDDARPADSARPAMEGEAGTGPTRAGGPSRRLLAILGAAAAVLAAFAVVAAFEPGADVANTAYVDIGGTAEVSEAARSALNTLYTYSPDTIDAYPDQARKVLTENMRGEFDKTIDPTVAAVKQGGTATTVQVTDVGVKVLDGDRAELITNVTVSAESNGVAQDSASGPLIVRMEKVGGVWLLSDIADQ
ncbi:mammalian cell entry protein [Rhodococcus sp. BH2-1]|nr:mammalian cell entry protein [Rhodococcus sp. BH2-1]